MKLTREQIQNIAKLARLAITEEEIEKYQSQLSSVLSYMEILNEVDTSDVAPTSQVTGLEDVFRADEIRNSDDAMRRAIISQFPQRDGDALVVPPVFE